MINYRYCDDDPWFGAIRLDWGDEGKLRHRVSSDAVRCTTRRFDLCIDKASSMSWHTKGFEDWVLTDELLVYTDGSKSAGGCGVSWVGFERGLELGRCGKAAPPSWSVVECELAAVLGALRMCAGSYTSVRVLLDCRPAVMLLDKMMCDGDLAEMWDVFTPAFNAYSSVSIGWIPGHMNIGGNEWADFVVKAAVGRPVDAAFFDGLCFGIEHLMAAREDRRNELLEWHVAEGHSYYKRLPWSPVHLQGLTRMDFYVLIRICSGTGVLGHDDCVNNLAQFHLTESPRFGALGPTPDKLFVDKHIPHYRKWWVRH